VSAQQNSGILYANATPFNTIIMFYSRIFVLTAMYSAVVVTAFHPTATKTTSTGRGIQTHQWPLSIASSDQFELDTQQQQRPIRTTRAPDFTSFDDFDFETIQIRSLPQQQQQRQSRRGSTTATTTADWSLTLSKAKQTFAYYRELQAAGLLEEGDSDVQAAKKAVEHFEDFRRNSDNSNNNLFGGSTGSCEYARTREEGGDRMERAVLRAAAALGKTTADIFGGVCPENYRD
jgi:hypothetical protein